MVAHWVKPSKTPERVVPRIASIAYQNTPRPAFQGPPVFPTFQRPDAKAGVATGTNGLRRRVPFSTHFTRPPPMSLPLRSASLRPRTIAPSLAIVAPSQVKGMSNE